MEQRGAQVDVSVSVVLYRDYATPSEMLESLERWTSPGLSKRVYVVDNGAPGEFEPGGELDTARKGFLELCAGLPDVEYVDAGGNTGFGAGNNIALRKAESRYHAFVNPDVLFVEDALSELALFLDEHLEAGMAIPRLTDLDGRLQPVYREEVTFLDALNRTLLGNRLKGRDRAHTMQGEDYSRPFRVPFGQGSFLFGRTSLLKGLGGFDERFFMYLEDADLCKRVNQSSELLYCPYATAVHKWERGSHKSARLLCAHLRSYAAYFKKWGFRFS